MVCCAKAPVPKPSIRASAMMSGILEWKRAKMGVVCLLVFTVLNVLEWLIKTYKSFG